jgi:hypothetical protein
MKKLRKKKLPIIIKITKKRELATDASSFGPIFIEVESTAYSMMSGHPSRLETINNVFIALITLSKL